TASARGNIAAIPCLPWLCTVGPRAARRLLEAGSASAAVYPRGARVAVPLAEVMHVQPLSLARRVLVRQTMFVPLLAACVGCGNSSGNYPVSGKVLYRGEPAAGATVTFVRKDLTDRMQERAPQGVVREDGTFTLVGPAGDGAQPGEYVVLIEWKQGA